MVAQQYCIPESLSAQLVPGERFHVATLSRRTHFLRRHPLDREKFSVSLIAKIGSTRVTARILETFANFLQVESTIVREIPMNSF